MLTHNDFLSDKSVAPNSSALASGGLSGTCVASGFGFGDGLVVFGGWTATGGRRLRAVTSAFSMVTLDFVAIIYPTV